jgi:hypothetical protein
MSDQQERNEAMIEIMTDQLGDLIAERDELDEQIDRLRVAISALKGDRKWSQTRGKTAGIAVRAAAASFTEPVSTQTLLDHSDLVNYSRQTLRSALAELHRTGQMTAVERTPHGYIWAPLGRNGDAG